jgi:hypothetical protein
MTVLGPHAPVRTAADLTGRWASLLGGYDPARRACWVTWVRADGSSPPLVVPIDDMPSRLDAMGAADLLDFAGTVAREDGAHTHAALALCRRGEPEPRPEETDWAGSLRRIAPERWPGLSWSLHLVVGRAVTALVPPPW